MGMNLTKGTGGGPADAPEAGTHEARIVFYIDLGTHPETFQGQPVGDKRKVYVGLEITDERDAQGNNKIMARDYTFSGHEKSGLFKLAEAALGPTPDGGHDMEKLLNQAVSVAVKINDKGYAEIEAVTALRPQQKAKVGKLDNPPFYWDLDSPAPYADHDWVPWVYSRAAGKRVKVSDMIAASRERAGAAKAGGAKPGEVAA